MAQDPNSPIARYRRQQADERAAETETEGPPAHGPGPAGRRGIGSRVGTACRLRSGKARRPCDPGSRRVSRRSRPDRPARGPRGMFASIRRWWTSTPRPVRGPRGVSGRSGGGRRAAPPSTRPQGGVRVDQAVVDEHAPPSPAGEEIRPLHETGEPGAAEADAAHTRGRSPRSPGSGQGPESGPAPAPTKPPRGPRGGGGSDGGSAGGSAAAEEPLPPAGKGVAADRLPPRRTPPEVATWTSRSPAPARTASRPVAGSARGEGLQVQTPRPGSDQLAPTPRGRLDEATAQAARRPVQVGEQAPAQAVRAAPVGEPVPAPQAPRPVVPRHRVARPPSRRRHRPRCVRRWSSPPAGRHRPHAPAGTRSRAVRSRRTPPAQAPAAPPRRPRLPRPPPVRRPVRRVPPSGWLPDAQRARRR